jgi:hypothetical protein
MVVACPSALYPNVVVAVVPPVACWLSIACGPSAPVVAGNAVCGNPHTQVSRNPIGVNGEP